VGNTSFGDIRTLSPEEHWAHFERSWLALRSYTYLGKTTPFLDAGVQSEAMPLRHDMRNSTGGIMAAPLCILSPEPWWRDEECVPAPVTMSYAVLDPAYDVRRLETLREVVSVGRQMGFSRSRIVDADDHGRIIALSTGSGVSLGGVPPGFSAVDNPVNLVADAPDLPALLDVFGIEPVRATRSTSSGSRLRCRHRTRPCTSAPSTSHSRPPRSTRCSASPAPSTGKWRHGT